MPHNAPRFCRSSTMFATSHTDDFFAIMRKRSAALLHRVRDSGNSLLNIISSKIEGLLINSLCSRHVMIYNLRTS
uniref:Uncharacterized protein n=1 Tax=Bombyx mori TaxID=7091 RepID=A0A8R2DN68_BOMMO|nr:uncharacterized protein LOC110385632 isoform X2 [Bombyx mori]